MICCPDCNALHNSESFSRCQCGFSLQQIDGFPAWAPMFALHDCGFKAEYFSNLADLEDGYFWFRARNRLIVWAIKHYFHYAKSFMEIGCGTGQVLSALAQEFPEMALTGSEIFVEGLGIASRRMPTAKLMQMDARNIPFVDEFDVVGAFDVLEHIAEDEDVLMNMRMAIKPYGGLILTIPQHPWLWSASDKYACHVRRYTSLDLHEKLERAGFEILRSTSFVSVLLPVMLVSRWRANSGTGSREFDPLDEFRIGAGLNRILGMALGMERFLIRVGVDFPVGGSRLIIARKKS